MNKSCLTPTRIVAYLGLDLNSIEMRAFLSQQRQSVLRQCLSQEGLGYSKVLPEAAWPDGCSQSGNVIGTALHARATVMDERTQSKSIRKWTVEDSDRFQLSFANSVVAVNSRPKGGSHLGALVFEGDDNNRCL